MSNRRFVPFAGFRPFFLLAGLSAVPGIGAWLWIYTHSVVPVPGLTPQAWHGHEMLFGFIVAAIAGFMLTALRLRDGDGPALRHRTWRVDLTRVFQADYQRFPVLKHSCLRSAPGTRQTIEIMQKEVMVFGIQRKLRP